MNIKDKHNIEKPVSTFSLFKSEEGTTTAIRILKEQQLKEHMTKVPALLICINGEVVFENEEGVIKKLLSGDFVEIVPGVKHWVTANKDSDMLLIK